MNAKDLSEVGQGGSQKEALLAAAKKLFVQKGYESVGTRELADEAGVNLGAIQYHYGSKADLFLAAIHELMLETGDWTTRAELAKRISSPTEAARTLREYIRTFLDVMLNPKGPEVCKLMHREVHSGGLDEEVKQTLISSIAEKFFKPESQALRRILRAIAPQAPEAEVHSVAHSVLGQCTFYGNERDFLHLIDKKDYAAPKHLAQVIDHIWLFTMRALGCPDDFISTTRE